MPGPVNPSVDPEVPQPANNAVPASDIEIIPKPVPSSSLADLQAASNTQDIANFGTTSEPVSLESDAVLAARAASNTDTTDFLGTPKPVLGDATVDFALASNTDTTGFTETGYGTSLGDPAFLAESSSIAGLTNDALLQPQEKAQTFPTVNTRVFSPKNQPHLDFSENVEQPLFVVGHLGRQQISGRKPHYWCKLAAYQVKDPQHSRTVISEAVDTGHHGRQQRGRNPAADCRVGPPHPRGRGPVPYRCGPGGGQAGL